MELIIVFVFSILIGIFVGTIPGLSISTVLLTFYPVLLLLDPVSILVFYIVVISMTQYFGSVSATFFSIPGSLTAIPTLKEAHTLFKQGDGDRAIMYAAIGSFIGALFAITVTLLLIPHISIFYTLFSTPIKTVIFLLAILLFVVNGTNSKTVNLLFLFVGLLLGQIGYSYILQSSILTFGWYPLYLGLPTIPVLIGLFVIPFLLLHIKKTTTLIQFTYIKFSGYLHHLLHLAKKKSIIGKSAIIGYLSGFIPGMSYLFGTILAYKLEKTRSFKTKDKDVKINSLLAAETANNSGAFSQILPLLLVGIPITGSQAILYDLIFWGKGIVLTIPYLQNIFLIICVVYFLSAVVGALLAGKYANYISIITKINFKYVYYTLIFLQGALVLYFGFVNYNIALYIAAFILALIIGLLLLNYDKMPIVFGFLLSEPIINNLYTLFFLIRG